MFPIDMFIVVFFLFEFEDMMYEKLLKIFIGIIYAQLFETIPLEIFKTEYIQNTKTRIGDVLVYVRKDGSLPFAIGRGIFGFEDR